MVYSPLEYSTSKVSSACHENDPHSLFSYSLQGGSCILLIIQLKYYRKREIKLKYKNDGPVNTQITYWMVLYLLSLSLQNAAVDC